MLNIARGIIISVAFILVCWWALQGVPTFQSCIQRTQQQAADSKPENYFSAFVIRADAYRDCLGDFVHDRKDEILVAFTVILAFSTIFLWVATRDLVSGAERVAKSQLRAYIGIVKTTITDARLGQVPVVSLHIKNFGQTPAYQFRCLEHIAIGNPPPIPEDDGERFVVNPSEERIFRISRGDDRGLSAEEYDGIMNDTKPLFIGGEIRYRDAFGRKHICGFRFQTDSEFIHTEERLMISPAGNHST